METTGYELDPFSELPPLPQEFNPMDYSRNFSSVNIPLDSLALLPHSYFTPSNCYSFSDYNHNDSSLSSEDAFFLDTSLSLLHRHHLAELTQLEQLVYQATRFDQLFHNEVATKTTTSFLHLPDLNDVATTTTTPFLHLPDLKSFEQTKTAVKETTNKLFSSLTSPKRQKQLGSSSSSTTSGSPTASQTIDGGASKQKRISDKIRSLEKIMPWEKKMSLAMILEESHKYIKFLQSQIAALRWMPFESVYNTAGEVGETDLLKSLTRQQILQVLANSPGSRNVLYTREVCVFSHEQLLLPRQCRETSENNFVLLLCYFSFLGFLK